MPLLALAVNVYLPFLKPLKRADAEQAIKIANECYTQGESIDGPLVSRKRNTGCPKGGEYS